MINSNMILSYLHNENKSYELVSYKIKNDKKITIIFNVDIITKKDSLTMKAGGFMELDMYSIIMLDRIKKIKKIVMNINDKIKQPLVQCFCMVCGKEFLGEEPKMCCSGRECGCMGMPIEPVVCSDECYKKIMKI